MRFFKPLTLLAACAFLMSGNQCEQANSGDNANPSKAESSISADFKKEDIKVGTGAEPKKGDKIQVHYTGWLTNGTKFDSSKDRGKPFEFILGQGQVIKGWDQGFAGMKEGGVRKLTIPSEMGYGTRGVGPIPANSTLIFEVELLKVLGK